MKQEWSFWVDRGGTFTDIIGRSPQGQLHAIKRLSETADGKDAAVQGINELLSLHGADLSALTSLRMGTTLGTNALLERDGARTVFVSTKGFADALRIAYQNRPKIFALEILLPEMIYEEVIEFHERLNAGGTVLLPPDLQRLESELRQSYEKGIRSCAIALMHAYRYPQHEVLAAELAKKIGFTQISTSHDCAALMKYVSRADTTLVDAYLTPLLRKYIDGLHNALPGSKLQFMQSNGGLAESSLFRGKDSILSGPAGGLVGAIKAAQSCGFEKIVTFDMGGTSTDVAYFAGEIDYIYDCEISGMRIRAPMMDIHTVAAGGGSILSFDGARYRVGPDSAGANPGPLSYKRNGPLALTDANVLLGRIQPDHFPCLFGPGANEPLDLAAVREAFSELAVEISRASGKEQKPEDVASGFMKIAIAKMANAIKHVSVQKGHDLRDCALVCFGGAGAQHACLIADELGITRILIHPLAGLLSAYGIGLAETRLLKDIDVNRAFEQINWDTLEQQIEAASADLSQMLAEKQISFEPKHKVLAHLRMDGSDYSLSIPYANKEQMQENFRQKHLKRYGFIDEKRALILDSLSVQIEGQEVDSANLKMPASSGANQSKAGKNSVRAFAFADRKEAGEWVDCALHDREQMQVGQAQRGPAIITEANTTTVVDRGWQAEKLRDGSLLLSRINDSSGRSANRVSGPAVVERDPVSLELFNNLFSFVAEQMGLTLQNTSQSVNIKERLDFSCAIFDADGNLVANAPHIPVHLGSMGESVKSLIAAKASELRPGDAYATNDPYNGGTHLPDLTIVSPAFDKSGKLIFFVASRGHHADIGGITPGSMPSDSRSIEEEGVLFQHMLVMRDALILEAEVEEHLESARYPARKVSQNLADLKAQVAANARGISQLEELIEKWGVQTVLAYMGYVQDNAERCVREAIASLNSGSFTCSMDDGSQISATIRIDKQTRSADIDFTGTSAQTDTNFNAPLAVCKAAVLYVFRTLVSDEIPLNAGCFRPLSLTVPEGCLLNPRYPAPVVAGNVETSQVIVDVLYAALGILAGSQGTMNNLSFGNEKYQYYETICGGTGAGAGFPGAGPVQSHMTNSRLTDPEVLESHFPVLLDSFAVRRGSGGNGQYRGGDGAIRQLRFLEPMTASILSNRRRGHPHGIAGGEAGLAGRNSILHADNSRSQLAFRSSFEVKSGEAICIETPGGGGFGPVPKTSQHPSTDGKS